MPQIHVRPCGARDGGAAEARDVVSCTNVVGRARQSLHVFLAADVAELKKHSLVSLRVAWSRWLSRCLRIVEGVLVSSVASLRVDFACLRLQHGVCSTWRVSARIKGLEKD